MSDWGAPCRDADRVSIPLFGRPRQWHRLGIEAVKFAELRATATRYGRFMAERADPWDFQTYNCRPVTGSTTGYSLHSWPRAVDIRPSENALRDDGVLVSDFDRFGLQDGVEFIAAFLACGFRWGATWSDSRAEAAAALRRNGQRLRQGRVDAHHFELDKPPVTDGWLRRLKVYAAKEPKHVAAVMAEAKVASPADLIEAWRAGTA